MSWHAFANADPELAALALERLHGRVANLGTSRANRAPRVHPVTPIIEDGARLFLFMEPDSPKGRDLRRDPRYALHCGVEDTSGGAGEVLVRGSATLVEDGAARTAAVAAAPYEPAERYVLFHLDVEAVIVSAYGDGGPVRRSWRGP